MRSMAVSTSRSPPATRCMPSRSLSRLAVVVVVIAAAAAVAVAIGVVVPREPSVAPSGAAVRASQLVAATPAGPIAAVGEFTWMSPYGKAGYRVTVIDAAGAVRFTT